ncbi:MAG TPA: Gmad2 immunoglobulin-like domain-containing protein [Ktedonobacteraceae bacterium]|nr:Gmad2 immunoglobulin-like domain-containing protein [Ktedonobacteraceae bacterium]
MWQKLSARARYLLLSAVLLFTISLALAACSGGSNGANATPTAQGTTLAGGNATPSATPYIGLGTRPCPDAVKAPSHWDPIIPTQSNISKVETVSCGNLIGNATLQALVTVRNSGSGGILDVYVYNNITSPNPTQLFKLLSLAEGDAKISVYNTILTGEVDANSSINKGKSDAQLTQDLFREFKWSDGAGTFVPISFPGIFPDMTRFQAERDQALVNRGQDAWKLDPAMVTDHMVSNPNLLNWPANSPTTIVSGGGSHDTEAAVSVKNPDTGGGTIKVTLQRLEGNTNGGIWEVVAVESNGMAITAPQSRDLLSSPVTVKGTGNAFEGKIGQVAVLDHLYTNIGQASATGAAGNGSTTFSVNVSFTTTFKAGDEDGLVVLYATNNAGDPNAAAAVMVKELLS